MKHLLLLHRDRVDDVNRRLQRPITKSYILLCLQVLITSLRRTDVGNVRLNAIEPVTNTADSSESPPLPIPKSKRMPNKTLAPTKSQAESKTANEGEYRNPG
jgi:hypothetical protein